MAPWTTGRHSCSDFHVLSRSFCIIVIVITIGIIIGIIIIAIDIIFVVITIVVTVRLMSTEQAVTCVVTLNFYPQISGMFYRSASLYHPQRRAIMHLKNQKREENFLFLWIFIFIFHILQEDQDQEGGQEPSTGRGSSFHRLLRSSQSHGKCCSSVVRSVFCNCTSRCK